MGSFSWLRADNLTQYINIGYEQSFKFLIPKEFGGGHIKDKYQDYGQLGTKDDGSPKYDMFEIVAFWNAKSSGVKHKLSYHGSIEDNKMKEIDEFTDKNRSVGIELSCYDEQHRTLKYPLKLVSASFNGAYEDLHTFSLNDPNQGCAGIKRKDYDRLNNFYEKGIEDLKEKDMNNKLNKQRAIEQIKKIADKYNVKYYNDNTDVGITLYYKSKDASEKNANVRLFLEIIESRTSDNYIICKINAECTISRISKVTPFEMIFASHELMAIASVTQAINEAEITFKINNTN